MTMRFKKSIKDQRVIVSLDIALNTTGVVIMDYNKYVYSSFLVEVNKSSQYYKKLDQLYATYHNIFSKIVEKEPKSIDLVLEDRLKAGWSGSTLASIEGARVTSYHAFRQAIKGSGKRTSVTLYNPGIIKKYFTNSRAAKKEVVYKSAIEKHKFLKKYDQEDILDAIYLALYHIETKNLN